MLDERLAAQQDNRVLFFLGLAVGPAIAATIFSWLANGRRKFNGFDWLILFLMGYGVLASGSKAALIPVVISYFGVRIYLGERAPPISYIVIALIALGLLTSILLLRSFFPELSTTEVLALLQYRIAANTDVLEYLYVLEMRPQDFPFAGFGALAPMFSKLIGYPFEFNAGTWLHGARFGDWSGFGPNSGPVMDYYANFGWFGLCAAILIGIAMRAAVAARNVIGCSALSLIPMSLLDSAMLTIALATWFGIYLVLRVTITFRLSSAGSLFSSKKASLANAI